MSNANATYPGAGQARLSGTAGVTISSLGSGQAGGAALAWGTLSRGGRKRWLAW